MLVKTPAMKLGLELRELKTEDERLILKGVAGAMPCSVELGGAEVRRLAAMILNPKNLIKILRLMFARTKEEHK